MSIEEIDCANCKQDISESIYNGYRIMLSSQKISNYDCVTCDVVINDPIPEPIYFCCLACVYMWLDQVFAP